jgi:CRISPR-associated protein Csb2
MAFVIESGLAPAANPQSVARALRRAVFARVQAVLGAGETLSPFFTGHAGDGAQARSGRHEHLSFVCDIRGTRLLLIAPHVLEHRSSSREEQRQWARLEQAMAGFCELRTGSSGKLLVRPSAIEAETDPFFAAASEWESAAPYYVTRHRKLSDAGLALSEDIATECRRIGLPQSQIDVAQLRPVPGAGLSGRARLRFRCVVRGPILIGRDRHFGGGLFAACSAS